MKILTIIVSYNFEPWLDRCLGSLRRSECGTDVVVIDNASQDGTVRRIRTDYPEVRLMESGENLGFGRANNLGMRLALKEGYEAVFLLNQDAWVAPDTLGTLAALLQQHPEYGILSPVHLTGKGDKLDPGFAHYAGNVAISQLPSHVAVLPLPFVNAAFWMIPAAVLKRVGGFCPLFYHYGEDKDFVNRLHYHHYRVGYCPKVFGHHDREYRPMTHAGFLRTESVYHLSEYANVHYTGLQAFGYGIAAVCKKALQNLMRGRFGLCRDYLKMAFSLWMRDGEVCIYREKNRISNPHYIL